MLNLIKKILPFLGGIMLLAACTQEPVKVTVPNDVIGEELMSEIIVQMHVMDAAVKHGKFSNNRDVITKHKQYLGVVSKFGVTKEQFEKSLAFYSTDPERLEKIYDKSLEIISVKQAKYAVSKKKTDEKKKVDKKDKEDEKKVLQSNRGLLKQLKK